MESNTILKETIKLARKNFPHTSYAVFIDFSRPASEHRFFLINIEDESIEYSWYTSHGKMSGGLEKATKFSNIPESKCSSKGMMKTAETYTGKYGLSVKLVGLERGVNDNVRRRSIVIHRSKYVSEDYMQEHDYPGRSWGCITLDPDKADVIIHKIKNGSMVYTYA